MLAKKEMAATCLRERSSLTNDGDHIFFGRSVTKLTR
jgi:hypothetical protein